MVAESNLNRAIVTVLVCAACFLAVESRCPRGWLTIGTGRSATCMKLFSSTRKNFNAAQAYCQQQGGYLARDLTPTIHNKIKPYIRNARNSGTHPSSFWIGLTDMNKNGGPWVWVGGPNLGSFKYWISNPRNTPNKQDCFYFASAESQLKWHVTNNCQVNRAVVCQRDYNPVVVKTTPAPRVTCPRGWTAYKPNPTCLRLYTQGKTWDDARTYCKNNGGDLVKIADGRMNGFVNALVSKQRGVYWIGLHDRHRENRFEWLDENTQTKFAYWTPHEPNNAGGNENCASILGTRNSRWNDASCASRYRFICQKAATINGKAPPPPTHLPVSPNCGTGWEDDPNTAYCFQFNTDRLSWLDAMNYCKAAGGHLASIGSVQEQYYLSGRSLAFDGDFFWIGANDRASERGWMWTDNTPFAFLNWDNGQPNNQRNSDCAVMVKKTGRWDDLPCQSRYASICKKVGKAKPTTMKPTTSPARLPNGQLWGCPLGWKKYRGSCYQTLRSPSGLDWNTAKTVCAQRLSSLVAITDASENRFVYSIVPRKAGAVWLGLNDQSQENSFSWADGTRITYTNWNAGEPNNAGNEDCVQMISGSGRWNDLRCNAKLHYLVCKQNAAAHSKSEFQIQQGCSAGSFGYGAQCYSYVYQPTTFSLAQRACKSKGGNLVTLDTRHVQAFVAAEMYHLPGVAYWIGLSSTTATQNAYAWNSGMEVDYTNWDMTHTGNEKNTCVAVKVARPAGLWLNFPCTTKLPYICEAPRKGFTTPVPTTTTTSRLPCSPGWWAWSNTCFKSFTPPMNSTMTYNDARDYCANMAQGGTLATIRNKRFSDWLKTKITQQGTPGRAYWIGLNDKDTEGGYTWEDGSPFLYNNWAPNEPNDYQKREDCVEWIFAKDIWNDNYCYLTNDFICQVPRGAVITTPKPTPTIGAQGGQCGNSSWSLYNNYCYFISPEDGDMALSTWFEARLTCMDMGGELSSITGPDENGYLTSLMSKHPKFSFWIGLNDLDQDTYKWTDRTPLAYVSWNKNEPNDALGGERCGEILSNGLWNDLNCQEKRGYLCKKRPGNYMPVHTSPAISKTAGCPPNFHTTPSASRCYYVGGTTQTTRKNYTDAITACNSVMTNSRLASLHSSIEEKYVVTLLAGLQWPAWIGFNDRRRRNRFEWIDNLNVDYVHWGWKQPDENLKDNSLNARRDCVDIEVNPKYAGNWNDKKCSQKYAYVCEYKKDTYYALEGPNTFGCSQGYQRYRNSCYKYVTQSYSWSQAEGLCTAEGGHLASLVDKFETAFVELLTNSQTPTQLWIGLSFSMTSQAYQWSDGWPVEYTHWGKGEPDRDDGEGCVSHTTDGSWQDVPCQMVLPYVCEINLGSPPAPKGPVYGTCPNSKWRAMGDYCYYLETKNLKSWPGANYACNLAGGALVSIHTDNEARFVTAMITSPQMDAWIGMNKGAQSGFTWSDHSETEYLNWAQGEPNDPDSGMHQDCVKAQAADGAWADTDCFDTNAYVCKVPKKTVVPSQGSVPPSGIVVTIPGQYNPNQPGYTQNPYNPNPGYTQNPYNPNPGYTQNPYNPNPGYTQGPYNPNPVYTQYPYNPNPVYTQYPYNPNQGKYTYNPFNHGNQNPPAINSGGSSQGLSAKVSGDSSSSSSLSGGAVAGIILGVIAIVAIAATVSFVMRRYFMSKTGIAAGVGGFDNATYHSSKVGDKVNLSSSDA